MGKFKFKFLDSCFHESYSSSSTVAYSLPEVALAADSLAT